MSRASTLRAAGLGLLCSVLLDGMAVAETYDLTVQPSDLSNAEIEERLEFLTGRLEERQAHAALWYYGWFSVSAATLGFSAVKAATTDDNDTRVASYVEIGKSAIDVANLVLRPMPARFGARPVYDLPDGTRQGELARLQEAERLLEEDAARAEINYSIWPQIGNLLLNLGGGAIILAYGNETDALISAGVGLLVGEIRIQTHPRASIDELAEYRQRFGSGVAGAGWSIAPRLGGLQVSYRF